MERVGWRFIRIRGSEYYRNPSKTIGRVIDELNAWDIFPETAKIEGGKSSSNQLFERVKIRAAQILDDWKRDEDVLFELADTESFVFLDESQKS